MISTTRLFIYISCSHQDKKQRLSWHHNSHSLEIPWWTSTQHEELSGSFTCPRVRCHVHVASRFWGCGQFVPFIIKRILGIKRIFHCSFWNKRMRLLTRVYGITKGGPYLKWYIVHSNPYSIIPPSHFTPHPHPSQRFHHSFPPGFSPGLFRVVLHQGG